VPVRTCSRPSGRFDNVIPPAPACASPPHAEGTACTAFVREAHDHDGPGWSRGLWGMRFRASPCVFGAPASCMLWGRQVGRARMPPTGFHPSIAACRGVAPGRTANGVGRTALGEQCGPVRGGLERVAVDEGCGSCGYDAWPTVELPHRRP
jgi:hypothetical protein